MVFCLFFVTLRKEWKWESVKGEEEEEDTNDFFYYFIFFYLINCFTFFTHLYIYVCMCLFICLFVYLFIWLGMECGGSNNSRESGECTSVQGRALSCQCSDLATSSQCPAPPQATEPKKLSHRFQVCSVFSLASLPLKLFSMEIGFTPFCSLLLLLLLLLQF